MPARRRKIISFRGKKNFWKLLLYVTLFSVFLTAFFYVKSTRKYWNGEDKVVVAVNEGKEVKVFIFDPIVSEIVQIVIPGNTEVEVARDLGIWKLSSVWELGKRENLEGKLLTRTLAKHFKFPVYIWADSSASLFWGETPFDIVKAIFSPYKTNLGVGDRLAMGLFALGVKNTQKVKIKLEDTGYIKKETLFDGEEGYRVYEKIPQKLAVFFVDQKEEGGFRVAIKDGSGSSGLAEDAAGVLEVREGSFN